MGKVLGDPTETAGQLAEVRTSHPPILTQLVVLVDRGRFSVTPTESAGGDTPRLVPLLPLPSLYYPPVPGVELPEEGVDGKRR